MAELLSVGDAQGIVLRYAEALGAVEKAASELLGTVLAEDIISDVDSPPFDKALMDGYAVRVADMTGKGVGLEVIEEVTAGQTPKRPIRPGQATRIMTGAPIPEGADVVVPFEQTQCNDMRVELQTGPMDPGKNIMARGREMRRGEKVLEAGTLLRPVELGILAAVGRVSARVNGRPRVAILSTGDEIVEAPTVPGPGQIRNSNGPMLTSLAQRAGGLPNYLGNAPDRLEVLQSMVVEGLKHDVLILCGGVSAGKLDLVPGALREGGVTAHFHKVAMKPGKPVFFGTRGKTLVFGLPGNPVASFVCFELFIHPAMRRLRGLAEAGPRFVDASCGEAFSHHTDRPTYHPARLEADGAGWRVRRVPWFGSPDLRSLAAANGLMLLPVGSHQFPAGHVLRVLAIDEGAG